MQSYHSSPEKYHEDLLSFLGNFPYKDWETSVENQPDSRVELALVYKVKTLFNRKIKIINFKSESENLFSLNSFPFAFSLDIHHGRSIYRWMLLTVGF